MSEPIKAGDKVVLLRNGDWYWLHESRPQPGPPVVGPVYTVREACVSQLGTPAIRLVGITCCVHPQWGQEWGWRADRFRRIWTQTTSLSVTDRISRGDWAVSPAPMPREDLER